MLTPDYAGSLLASSSAAEPLAQKVAPGYLFLERLGFFETELDPDGTFDGLLLPRDQYVLLWRCSWLALLSALVATVRGHFDMCWVPWLVLASSLNYWRAPSKSWRRALDIGCVFVGIGWNFYRAAGAQYGVAHYVIAAIGMLGYLLGLYCDALHNNRVLWPSTLLHVLVHLCGNAANVTLYCGTIPTLSWGVQGHNVALL